MAPPIFLPFPPVPLAPFFSSALCVRVPLFVSAFPQPLGGAGAGAATARPRRWLRRRLEAPGRRWRGTRLTLEASRATGLTGSRRRRRTRSGRSGRSGRRPGVWRRRPTACLAPVGVMPRSAARASAATCLAPGGVDSVMSPQLTLCELSSHESSSGGFCRAQLTSCELRWISAS